MPKPLTDKTLVPGTWVRWTSQAQGYWVTKRGKVLAILPAKKPLAKTYMAGEKTLKTPKGLVGTSLQDRVIVAVVVNPSTGLQRIYAPMKSVLLRDGEALTLAEARTKLDVE